MPCELQNSCSTNLGSLVSYARRGLTTLSAAKRRKIRDMGTSVPRHSFEGRWDTLFKAIKANNGKARHRADMITGLLYG